MPTRTDAGDGPSSTQRSFVDQMQRLVELPHWPPRRLISLVPSQTELLFDLGAGDRVVGRTRFCVRPEAEVEAVTRIGGTKSVDLARVASLNPDLIIGNKEENERSDIEALAERHPVWMSDVCDLAGAVDMIRSVGELIACATPAERMAAQIADGFAEPFASHGPRVAYLIWRKPYMVAGAGTFIDDLLTRCGFDNVFGDPSLGRYPEISSEDLAAASLDAILLSSEPFPFEAKHVAEFAALCPTARIELVDGEHFSWFGSRLIVARPALQRLANHFD